MVNSGGLRPCPAPPHWFLALVRPHARLSTNPSLFAKPLGLEAAVRLWDRCVVCGPDEVLRCAVGLLRLLEPRLLAAGTIEAVVGLLVKPPQDAAQDEYALGRAVDAVRLTAAEREAARA